MSQEDFNKKNEIFSAKRLGLPDSYPVPNEDEDVLFYIQRNLNTDTIIYQLNRNANGDINTSKPLNVYWRRYNINGEKKELNRVQEELAFGYSFEVINTESIEFSIVGYPELRFFIGKRKNGDFAVFSKLREDFCVIRNVYVYAEDYGVFPDVKYAEIFAIDDITDEKKYYKIIVD